MVVETRVDKASFILVSMYFDINRPMEIDLKKMQEILTHAEGVGAIFAIDSNADPPHGMTCSLINEGRHWRNS